ncbi:MAG TPA: hypothetical protein VJL60_04890, partial [Gammaproteobacteria bacterium]|nr:hypothetical protein [Gammaproteobacteria bacterium]
QQQQQQQQPQILPNDPGTTRRPQQSWISPKDPGTIQQQQRIGAVSTNGYVKGGIGGSTIGVKSNTLFASGGSHAGVGNPTVIGLKSNVGAHPGGGLPSFAKLNNSKPQIEEPEPLSYPASARVGEQVTKEKMLERDENLRELEGCASKIVLDLKQQREEQNRQKGFKQRRDYIDTLEE